jgi:hypothetical protein
MGSIKNTHQNTEWNLDADATDLYRHKEGIWTKHRAVNYGRLMLESAGVTRAEPHHITHKTDGTHRRRQIDLSELHAVRPHEPEGRYNPTDSIYTSAIGECFHALPKHVKRLVGNIPDIVLPANFDCTEPTDLIVATYGSVLFGVGYHSCLILTKEEHTLLHGGDPNNGSPLYMASYRSELVGYLRRAGSRRGNDTVLTDQHQDSPTSMR